ncbi:hypothetical protein B0920_22290 [Massilia sp. KIM]|nr:hypothetical protein B0920_22290 [Massilia sp. KIM]
MKVERLRPATGAVAGGWPAVASVALATFVMVTSEFLPIGLLGAIARDMGESEGHAGLMVTVPGFTAALAAPVAALFAGRVDRRTMLLLLSTLIAAANLIAACAGSFAVLLAGRVLLGLSVGGFWAFAAAVGRRLVAAEQGNRATAIVLAGISTGTVLGVPFATAIGNSAGWRSAFGVVAMLALAAAVAQLRLLPRLPGSAALSLRSLPELMGQRALLAGLAAAALVAGGHFMAYTYLEPFLARVAGMEGTGVGMTLMAYGLAGVAGTFVGERLAGRDVRRAFVAAAVLMAAALGAGAVLGAHAWAAAVLVVAWGLAFGAIPVSIQLWMFRAAPSQVEASSAMTVTIFQLALGAGAAGGGWLVDQAGLRSAYVAGALLSLAAVAPLLAFASLRHRD